MGLQPSDVKKTFCAGNYLAVLQATIYSEFRQYAAESIPFIVSSLAAIGQLREAELTLALKFEELTADDLVFVYYHLAVANVNAGRFDQAAAYVIKASRLRFLFKDNGSNFYLFMAFAYHRYASGKARQGISFAYRAGGFLNKSSGSYPLFLWLELMSNLAFLTGDVANAEDYCGEAKRAAKEISRNGSIRALSISSALHKSKHSRDSAASIAELERAFGELAPLDVFLKASVCFEIVRHNALLGRLEAATKVYRQALTHASRFSSRRMNIVRLLRQVDIHLAEGNFHFCFPILEMIDEHLLQSEDRVYAVETLDKMSITCFSLSLSKQFRSAEIRLAKLIQTTGADYQRQQRNPVQASSSLSFTGSLNYRQIAFLAEMQAGQSVDVHHYRDRFGVSEITACRDLSQLTAEKYLIRVGKARATKYIKPDDQYLEIIRSAQTSQNERPDLQTSADAPALQ